MGYSIKETSWNHLSNTGQKETHGTFYTADRKWINKVKRLAEKHPGEVDIRVENPDGSIVAHIPINWFKLSPPRKISEDYKAILAQRMRTCRESNRQSETE